MVPISTLWRTVWRRFHRHAGFAAIAVGSVAIGVAATSLLASLAAQVLLRELPVPQPSRLVWLAIQNLAADGRLGGDSTLGLADVEELTASVADQATLAAYAGGSAVVAAGRGVERLEVEWVTPSYFVALGLQPQAGRLFDARDGRGAGVAVAASRAARDRFGGAAAAVNAKIVVDGRPLTVVGVAPESFHSVEVGDAPDFFLLASEAPAARAYFRMFGRLAPAATEAALEGSLRTTLAAIHARHPEVQRYMIFGNETLLARERLDILPGARGRSALRGTFSSALAVVAAMLAVFLLVLAANLANLLAARAIEERAMMGLQLALGASRWRLTFEWMLEGLAVALAGTCLGLWGAAAVSPFLLRSLPVAGLEQGLAWRFDWVAVSAGVAVALPLAIAIGGVAAWEAARASYGSILVQKGATAARGRARWRFALVAVQVALSMVLLVGMSLLVRTLGALLAVDTGLPLEQVVSFRVDLPATQPLDPSRYFSSLHQELAALPGVDHAGYGSNPALAWVREFSMLAIEGYQPAAGESLLIPTLPLSPGTVEALALPLLQGRSYAPSEAQGPPRTILVNQRFVDRYLPGVDPIGRHVSFAGPRSDWSGQDSLEIVGVVAEGRLTHVQEEPTPRVFPLVPTDARTVTFFLRSAADPLHLAPQVRSLLEQRYAEGALGAPITLARQRDILLAEEHFLGRLSLAFGLSAAALAALGLYGVLSYAMRNRQREIALRMALGARAGAVLRLVGKSAALAVASGAVVGGLAAIPAARWLETFLFGVEPHDAASFLGALGLLLAVALVAWWFPARRSTRIDPARLLHTE
jgi:putative ABC transport system permease protein